MPLMNCCKLIPADCMTFNISLLSYWICLHFNFLLSFFHFMLGTGLYCSPVRADEESYLVVAPTPILGLFVPELNIKTHSELVKISHSVLCMYSWI